MNLDLHKISFQVWMAILMSVMIGMSSGTISLFLIDRQLFLSLDTIKLILLSLSLFIPVFLTNCFMVFIYDIYKPGPDGRIKREETLFIMLLASFCTVPVMYVPILAKYLLGLTNKDFILWVLITQILIWIFGMIVGKGLKRVRNNDKKN